MNGYLGASLCEDVERHDDGICMFNSKLVELVTSLTPPTSLQPKDEIGIPVSGINRKKEQMCTRFKFKLLRNVIVRACARASYGIYTCDFLRSI